MNEQVPAQSPALHSNEKTLLTVAYSWTPVSGGSFVSTKVLINGMIYRLEVSHEVRLGISWRFSALEAMPIFQLTQY